MYFIKGWVFFFLHKSLVDEEMFLNWYITMESCDVL